MPVTQAELEAAWHVYLSVDPRTWGFSHMKAALEAAERARWQTAPWYSWKAPIKYIDRVKIGVEMAHERIVDVLISEVDGECLVVGDMVTVAVIFPSTLEQSK